MFEGTSLSLKAIEGGLAELCFNASENSVNKFDRATVDELTQALEVLKRQKDVQGLLITSGKPVFIVGADITEFVDAFTLEPEEFRRFLFANNKNFNAIEDLPYPTAVAINGYALGGGFEVCLACDFRVMSTAAQVGLPETKLGIIPGWGGTVRMPRLIGLDTALEWIASGAQQKADKALKAGAVDAVVEPALLREETLKLLKQAAAGEMPYEGRREQKKGPLRHNTIELQMAAVTGKAAVSAQAGGHYPAPVAVADLLAKAAGLEREAALEEEFKVFGKVSRTPQARALVGIFLNDQYLGRLGKKAAAAAPNRVERTAVLGAGIMGGGIAYQNAIKGFSVLMKDINSTALEQGMSEASKLLSKRVERGRLSPLDSCNTLARITPTLSFDGIEASDLVIEAVVENEKIKGQVLPDVESRMKEEGILASNTSTISITRMAKKLRRPENFCGMHFFNPVHAMPLVEVIRGEKTSDATVAVVVSHAEAMGKKPVVVNDGPGFLVNRVLFGFMYGFERLVSDGADFGKVDKVMEKWGWPMGPAYLSDVVGIDTIQHCYPVMADGLPDRFRYAGSVSPTQLLLENERLGQKNGKGFYQYVTNAKGKPEKKPDEQTAKLFAAAIPETAEFSEDEIVARHMIPMCMELARCLEDGIVGTPAEADMALIYGIGFPPFRGGAFRWMDEQGLAWICDTGDKLAHLGKLYEPTDKMRQMAAAGEHYYG